MLDNGCVPSMYLSAHDISVCDCAEKFFFLLTNQEDDIETAMGTLHVVVQGDRNRPAILTYHDIGLNSKFVN